MGNPGVEVLKVSMVGRTVDIISNHPTTYFCVWPVRYTHSGGYISPMMKMYIKLSLS